MVAQIAVPEWMLSPQVCDQFTDEAEPRISIDALLDLRRLIDAQRLGKRLMIMVVQNLHQEVTMHSKENPSLWQRKLRFEERRDLDHASGIGKGTMPNPVAPIARERAQERQREAK